MQNRVDKKPVVFLDEGDYHDKMTGNTLRHEKLLP